MLSTVLSATAVLRLHYRRIRSIGLLGAVTALGLVPLSLYMPRPDWARYTLLSMVCLYAGRKVIQFLRSRSALKQLSMEEHFIRYGSSAGHVQKCVENEDHLWTRSCILGGLKGVMHHPITTDMIGDEKRNRVYRQFHRAFRKLEPARAYLDVGLLLSMLILLSSVPSIGVDLRAVLFQAGFLALAIAGFAEVSHFMIHRQLFETMQRLYAALTEWAIREALHAAVTVSYSHRLLYFAQPWFVNEGTIERGDVGTLGRGDVRTLGRGDDWTWGRGTIGRGDPPKKRGPDRRFRRSGPRILIQHSHSTPRALSTPPGGDRQREKPSGTSAR